MEEAEAIGLTKKTEEEKDLQNQIERGQNLEVMVSTIGWNQILAPWLNGMKNGFERGIRNAKKLEDFLAAQQNINLIETIFSYIISNIELGKGASRKLARAEDDKIEENTEK